MTELLDLLARWVHVVAGIMWVGNSMLFNFLDRNLRKRSEPDSYGDIWLLHSGGFYLMEKNKGERSGLNVSLPTPLHWFKWQAYTTWITGALLLIIVYYAGGRALLEDPTVLPMTHEEAVIKAVGALVLSVLAYEGIFRSLGRRVPVAAALLGLVVLGAMVMFFTAHFNGRAAFLHIGATLGTIMAFNVAFTIMPSQRELVAALSEGRPPSQEIADRAKTRSIHNNYITFPVIVLMVSAHFPSLYASNPSSLTALILIVGGAGVRHWMNVRFTTPSWKVWLPLTVVTTVVLLAMAVGVAPKFGWMRDLAPPTIVDLSAVPEHPTFEDAQHVIQKRCAVCHSATPSDISLGRTPNGVAFDTPQQILALVLRINERAVVQKTMPPGNKTMITDGERAIIGRWIASGASIR